MRVAHICQPSPFQGPPVQEGSIEIVVAQLAQHLTAHAGVSVYALRGRGQTPVEWYEGVRYRRVSARLDAWPLRPLRLLTRPRARAGAHRPRFASTLTYLGYITQVALDLRAYGVNVVHIHNYSQFVPIVRVLHPQARIVLHMHCEWLTQLDYTMINRRLAKTDLIVSPSAYVTGLISRRFPHYASRCGVVPNGVDTTHFVPGAAPVGAASGAGRIVCVARISPEKGLHVLIEAFKDVAARHPGARLEIVGRHDAQLGRDKLFALSDPAMQAELAPFYTSDARDNYYQLLRRQAAALGIADRVTFPGHLPHAELVERYRSADALAFPSVWPEAFGLPIVEAQAAGVPVLATRNGAFTELISSGVTGLLVERSSAPAMAEALNRLLDDAALRSHLRSAAREHVCRHYAWPIVASDLAKLYAQLFTEERQCVVQR